MPGGHVNWAHKCLDYTWRGTATSQTANILEPSNKHESILQVALPGLPQYTKI